MDDVCVCVFSSYFFFPFLKIKKEKILCEGVVFNKQNICIKRVLGKLGRHILIVDTASTGNFLFGRAVSRS